MERIILHGEDHRILWKNQDWRASLAEVRRMEKFEAEVKLIGILSLGALLPRERRKYGNVSINCISWKK